MRDLQILRENYNKKHDLIYRICEQKRSLLGHLLRLRRNVGFGLAECVGGALAEAGDLLRLGAVGVNFLHLGDHRVDRPRPVLTLRRGGVEPAKVLVPHAVEALSTGPTEGAVGVVQRHVAVRMGALYQAEASVPQYWQRARDLRLISDCVCSSVSMKRWLDSAADLCTTALNLRRRLRVPGRQERLSAHSRTEQQDSTARKHSSQIRDGVDHQAHDMERCRQGWRRLQCDGQPLRPRTNSRRRTCTSSSSGRA